MVVFENGQPNKKEYKRFKIRTLEEGKPDDFAAMLEVLKRRFMYLVKSKSDIKFRKKKDVLTGKLDKEIVGECKYEIFDDLDYFTDIKLKEGINEFLLGLIQKAKNNRVYIGVPKKYIDEAEKLGFQLVKKMPNEVKMKKTYKCLLFNKSKYKENKIIISNQVKEGLASEDEELSANVGVLEAEWKPNLSTAKGIELIKTAISSSRERDAASGFKIQVCTIDKDGYKQIE